jgi:hypothetical protein
VTLIAHAITADARRPVGDGLRGRPLELAEAAGLGLWSTRWDGADKLERTDALEHHRIVERICAAQPCLPVRFGTSFADDDRARASLTERAALLRQSLERVAGKTELALTLLWRALPAARRVSVAVGGPGRQYLEGRRAEHADADARTQRAEALVERIVAGLAIERQLVWHETCTSPAVAASLAVLVPTAEAHARKAELARIAGSLDEVTAVVNGPWPPYTFAGIP